MPLTVAAISKYNPRAIRYEVPDVHALRLLVHPSGSKSWVMRFRKPDGKLAKLTLGPVDLISREIDAEPVIGQPLTLVAARRLASAVQRDRAMGRDVIADRQADQRRKALALDDAARNTFAGASMAYIQEERRGKALNRRWQYSARILGLSYADDTAEPSLIPGGLAERWWDKPVSSISADDLHELIHEAREVGVPGLKSRVKSPCDGRARDLAGTLMTMWRWLTRKRRVPVNVAVAFDKPRPYPARDRVLSDCEIRWLWQACEEIGQPFGPLVKLLLLLGQRRDEVGGILWSELSPDLSTWTLPGSRVKNGKSHIVPLPPLAQELIGAMPRIVGSGFVFTGRTARTCVSGFSKIKKRLDGIILELARAEEIERGDNAEKVTVAGWSAGGLAITPVGG